MDKVSKDSKGDEEKNILSVIPGITDYSSIYYSKFNEEVEEEDPDGYFERNILSYKNKLRLKYVFERNFFTKNAILLQKNGFQQQPHNQRVFVI